MKTSRCLAALCLFLLQVEGDEDFEVLGLAEDAFDDQYLGCRQAMEKQLEARGTLAAELSANKKFQENWKEAESLWHSKMKDLVSPALPEGFSDPHGVALVTFTSFQIREEFNEEVKSAGRSHRAYTEEFNFKYLHYYLTVALQLLYEDCKGGPPRTYRGFERVIHLMPMEGAWVKFGHSLHTSADFATAYEMGNSSFFTVQSCSGVPVHKFSDYPHEKEVVFPGYELFRVTRVLGGPNEFYLNGTGRWCSNFNCALIRGEASRVSLRDCMNSEDEVTWSDREAWLHNMTEKDVSAAPPGPVLLSGATGLLAAVVTSCLLL